MAGEVAFGAIRWDGQYPNGSGQALATARALSAEAYRGRAPLHTDTTGNLIEYKPTQETMDAEITAAATASLKYWAFLKYEGSEYSDFFIAEDLYHSSSIKSQVKYCYISQMFWMGTPANHSAWVSATVAKMSETNWMKVLGNRPLLYIYWSQEAYTSIFSSSLANVKIILDDLRAACVSAGMGTPYIVVMHRGAPIAMSAMLPGIGANAVTDYIAQGLAYDNRAPYTALTTICQAFWATCAAALGGGTIGSVVPICMAGWDARPRIDRPVPWDPDKRPFIRHDRYINQPSNSELNAQMQAAKTYVMANPTVCPASIVLVYAWNEFDEGGWLAPTIGDPAGSRLAAIAATIS